MESYSICALLCSFFPLNYFSEIYPLFVSVVFSFYCTVVFICRTITQCVHHFSVFGDFDWFYFLIFTNKASINTMCNYFCRLSLSFLMSIYLDVLLLDSNVGIYNKVLRYFPQKLCHFSLAPQLYENSSCSISSTTINITNLFLKKFFFFNFVFWLHHASLFPDQGLNPGPQALSECGVLTTGLPGNF